MQTGPRKILLVMWKGLWVHAALQNIKLYLLKITQVVLTHLPAPLVEVVTTKSLAPEWNFSHTPEIKVAVPGQGIPEPSRSCGTSLGGEVQEDSRAGVATWYPDPSLFTWPNTRGWEPEYYHYKSQPRRQTVVIYNDIYTEQKKKHISVQTSANISNVISHLNKEKWHQFPIMLFLTLAQLLQRPFMTELLPGFHFLFVLCHHQHHQSACTICTCFQGLLVIF